MATKNPRVQVMLTPEQYEILSRFSVVMGQSRSAVCAEILGDVFPVLEKLASAVEMARTLEEGAKEGWKESVLRKLSPAELSAEHARDEALQAMHSMFQTMEETLHEAAAGREGAPASGGASRPAAASCSAEPPSL